MKRLILNRLFLAAVIIATMAATVVANDGGDRGETSPLAAGTVVLLGDSNTWIGGDECDDPRGWNCWFAREMNPGSIRSYARSGATWSHTVRTATDLREYSEVITDNNVVYNQVMRLTAAVDSGLQQTPDLIMIAAGTNDAWFPHLRPEEFSRTAAEAAARDATELLSLPPSKVLSLPEAVRYDLLILHSHFPDARIIVMTPIQSIKISDNMLTAVSEMIETAATAEGAAVLRQDLLCPVRSGSEMTCRRLTSDGTHTSAEGARLNALVICDFVRTIYHHRSSPSSDR